MAYGNDVFIRGNVGKDPDHRFTSSGKAVSSFSMATSKPGAKKEDKWRTEWHNIVCWGKAAEKVKNLFKGDRVMLHGEIINRSWDDKDGNKKYKTEIVVNFADDITIEKRSENTNGNSGNDSQGDNPGFSDDQY